MKTSMSTRGQLVIPKAVRERHRWEPGTDLEVVDLGDCVLLRRPTLFAPTDLAAGFGMLRCDGEPLDDAAMNAAVDDLLAKQWQPR